MKFKTLCEKQENPLKGISIECLDKTFRNQRIIETCEKRIRKFFVENITKDYDGFTESYLKNLIKDSKYISSIYNFSKYEKVDDFYAKIKKDDSYTITYKRADCDVWINYVDKRNDLLVGFKVVFTFDIDCEQDLNTFFYRKS